MSAALVIAGGVPAGPRPPLYGDLRRWALVQADAVTLLAQLPDASVDAIVTDPPYGLNFDNQAWDGGTLADGLGFQVFSRVWAEQARRVLRPGGYLVSFGAPRTVHRLVAGVEDADFEIRDGLLWLFGSGMPKSRRMPGGLGSALKPAYEPILLARAPLDPATPRLLDNLAAHGTGALNIRAARLVDQPYRDPATGELVGRWPANLLLGHDAGCGGEGCTEGCVVAEIDRQYPSARPSRYFYCGKATTGERDAGLQELPKAGAGVFSASGTAARANIHPTVKPLGLMRWLIRLVVPPGGVVLDPFSGSGSTGCAAVLEGRQFIGVEREAAYLPIARARMAHWAQVARSGRAA